ncbi:hypothetical protein [Candidatus Borrarchaeum sp.]|uniref:hypothetical protein n=1 Tax=Candidatus Borrarchaeum sp. TaxID=2846742 RepID=UPI00257D8A4F|nr:hypothetical protein [Candidatus Borrarchaeum sp.]
MEPQPHLDYLIKATEAEQKIAFRIWASTEGCIYAWNSSQKNVYPALEIACAHPKLLKQLHQIAVLCNINMIERRSKCKWSGKEGLCTYSLKSCVEFLKLGGFIQGVKISSHSKYHKDINKGILLLGILEFKIRQKKNSRLRKLSSEKIHQEINKITRNKQYNTKQFYIDYFSK